MNSFNKKKILPNINTIISCRNLQSYSLSKNKNKKQSLYENYSLSNNSKFRNMNQNISNFKDLVDKQIKYIMFYKK